MWLQEDDSDRPRIDDCGRVLDLFRAIPGGALGWPTRLRRSMGILRECEF